MHAKNNKEQLETVTSNMSAKMISKTQYIRIKSIPVLKFLELVVLEVVEREIETTISDIYIYIYLPIKK